LHFNPQKNIAASRDDALLTRANGDR
jgi:hypothetical protein